MGRQLFGLFHRAGLTQVAVETGNAVVTDYAQADRLFRISEGLDRAQTNGAVTEEAAADWTRDLAEAVATGRFFSSLTAFIVAARRS